MQKHPLRERDGMEAHFLKLLSLNANQLIIWASNVIASVLRRGHVLRLRLEAHATAAKQQATKLCLAMLFRLAAYKNLALASLSGLSAILVPPEMPWRAPRDAGRVVEPARLSLGDQWQRATAVIAAALASFQRVERLHAAATRQIDSADYALMQLLHDLRPAMALPADVSGLRAVLAEAERTAPKGYHEPAAALAA